MIPNRGLPYPGPIIRIYTYLYIHICIYIYIICIYLLAEAPKGSLISRNPISHVLVADKSRVIRTCDLEDLLGLVGNKGLYSGVM